MMPNVEIAMKDAACDTYWWRWPYYCAGYDNPDPDYAFGLPLRYQYDLQGLSW